MTSLAVITVTIFGALFLSAIAFSETANIKFSVKEVDFGLVGYGGGGQRAKWTQSRLTCSGNSEKLDYDKKLNR